MAAQCSSPVLPQQHETHEEGQVKRRGSPGGELSGGGEGGGASPPLPLSQLEDHLDPWVHHTLELADGWSQDGGGAFGN